ncbi:hypothetical protein HZC07_04855 [Candidatus Micrarchaeota archaeon]|nr:hypothetical protein [Candidatus Micrarchaeota archaeon]
MSRVVRIEELREARAQNARLAAICRAVQVAFSLGNRNFGRLRWLDAGAALDLDKEFPVAQAPALRRVSLEVILPLDRVVPGLDPDLCVYLPVFARVVPSSPLRPDLVTHLRTSYGASGELHPSHTIEGVVFLPYRKVGELDPDPEFFVRMTISDSLPPNHYVDSVVYYAGRGPLLQYIQSNAPGRLDLYDDPKTSRTFRARAIGSLSAVELAARLPTDDALEIYAFNVSLDSAPIFGIPKILDYPSSSSFLPPDSFKGGGYKLDYDPRDLGGLRGGPSRSFTPILLPGAKPVVKPISPPAAQAPVAVEKVSLSAGREGVAVAAQGVQLHFVQHSTVLPIRLTMYAAREDSPVQSIEDVLTKCGVD